MYNVTPGFSDVVGLSVSTTATFDTSLTSTAATAAVVVVVVADGCVADSFVSPSSCSKISVTPAGCVLCSPLPSFIRVAGVSVAVVVGAVGAAGLPTNMWRRAGVFGSLNLPVWNVLSLPQLPHMSLADAVVFCCSFGVVSVVTASSDTSCLPDSLRGIRFAWIC